MRVVRTGGTHLEVPGFPGLKKSEREDADGNWQIVRTLRGKRYRLALPVSTLDAAKRLYTTFELDPEGFMRSLRRRSGPPDYPAMIDRYLEHLLVTNGSPKTRDNAASLLKKLQQLAVNLRLDMNSVPLMTAFLQMGEKNANTRRVYIIMMRTFLNWCVREDLIDFNALARMKLPSRQETTLDRRRIISEEEIEKVCGAVKVERHIYALMILWSMGLRKEELMRYRPQDVSRERMELMIARSKRGKTRYVPIPDLAVYNALVKLLKHRPKAYLQVLQAHLDNVYARTPNLSRFTLHALRHSRITLWLREGCSPYDVQRWAGHSSLAQTMNYVGEIKQSLQPPKPTPWAPTANQTLVQFRSNEDANGEAERREDKQQEVLPGRAG